MLRSIGGKRGRPRKIAITKEIVSDSHLVVEERQLGKNEGLKTSVVGDSMKKVSLEAKMGTESNAMGIGKTDSIETTVGTSSKEGGLLSGDTGKIEETVSQKNGSLHSGMVVMSTGAGGSVRVAGSLSWADEVEGASTPARSVNS